MSYLGQGPQFASFPSKFFDGDGSAMTVTLDYAPPNLAALLVFIAGVRQDTSAYTLSGTSLTFTGTVPSGTANVQVVHLGLQVDVGTPGDDTVTNAKLANMAANTVKVRDANSSGDPSDKALATTEVLIGDGTGFTAAALSSDVTMTNAGAVTIAANAVTLAKLEDGTQGDILYYGASGAPTRLGFGTSGDFLKTQGTGANPVWASAGGTNTPYFYVGLASDQVISDETYTKVSLASEALDSGNYYDNSTNYRYTPLISGKYFFFGCVNAVSDTANDFVQVIALLYKNGSATTPLDEATPNSNGRQLGLHVSAILDMNGSSDYVELFAFLNVGSGTPIIGGASNFKSWFGGYKLIE